MRFLSITLLIGFFFTSHCIAAEKKKLDTVNTIDLMKETQISLIGTSNKHLSMAWWIPFEFWKASFDQDTSISGTDKKTILEALDGIAIIAILQADISKLGSFTFYTKEKVQENLVVTVQHSKSGQSNSVTLVKDLNPDLELILNVISPMLTSAMGNMGSNFHFFVFEDVMSTTERVFDPYGAGSINISVRNLNDEIYSNTIETPLNSLFIPRKCPNGKDAHISWQYCPWTGVKLED